MQLVRVSSTTDNGHVSFHYFDLDVLSLRQQAVELDLPPKPPVVLLTDHPFHTLREQLDSARQELAQATADVAAKQKAYELMLVSGKDAVGAYRDLRAAQEVEHVLNHKVETLEPLVTKAKLDWREAEKLANREAQLAYRQQLKDRLAAIGEVFQQSVSTDLLVESLALSHILATVVHE